MLSVPSGWRPGLVPINLISINLFKKKKQNEIIPKKKKSPFFIFGCTCLVFLILKEKSFVKVLEKESRGKANRVISLGEGKYHIYRERKML